MYSFELHQADDRLDAWCATLSADSADTDWNRGDIEEHVRDEHSTFSWLLEPMIERVGFGIEHADYSDDGIFARCIARKR